MPAKLPLLSLALLGCASARSSAAGHSSTAGAWLTSMLGKNVVEKELLVEAVDHISLLAEFCTVQGGKNCAQVVGGSSADAGYSNVAGVTDCANCSAAWSRTKTVASVQVPDNAITVDSTTTAAGRFSSTYSNDKCCNLTNSNTADRKSQAGVPSSCASVKTIVAGAGSGEPPTETQTYTGDCPTVGNLVAYTCAAPNEVCCFFGGKTFKAFMSADYHCCAVDTYAHYECPDTYQCGNINSDKQQIKCIPPASGAASVTMSAMLLLASVAISTLSM